MIAVFGDSIAFGHNDPDGGYVKKLSVKNKIINRSISGETSTGLLRRIEAECAELKPQMIILAIGINDAARFLGNNQTGRTGFKENYTQLVRICKEHSDHVLCLGLTKVDEDIVCPVAGENPFSIQNNDIKEYDNIIEKIAQKNMLRYIYLYDVLNKKDLDDGLHPNSRGHKKIYEKIKKLI